MSHLLSRCGRSGRSSSTLLSCAFSTSGFRSAPPINQQEFSDGGPFGSGFDSNFRNFKRSGRHNTHGFYPDSRHGGRQNATPFLPHGDQTGLHGSFEDFHLRSYDWNAESLVAIRKDFYKEHPDVSARSQEEIDAFLQSNDIVLSGNNLPRPIQAFEEANLPDLLLDVVKKQKFPSPTSIQRLGWPIALSGRDLVGISATGSGKTLAFLVPSIVHVKAQEPLRPGDGPIVLVLSPTRELTVQSLNESNKFSRSMRLRSVAVFGGASRGPQERALRKGAEIVMATPGRLLDFLNSGVTNLKRVSYLVLDEADRMMDMGFEPQIRQILSQIRPDRQVTMWTATWPNEVSDIAKEFTRDPVKITVGSEDLSACSDVEQTIQVVDNRQKTQLFLDLLSEEIKQPSFKILVFANSKRESDRLTMGLRRCGINSLSLHGDKSQHERDWVMNEFRSGRAQILCATDVASRGLDVSDISLVVNFDFPSNLEDYVHRVGRTGRAGKSGRAVSFFTEDVFQLAPKLASLLQKAEQEVPQDLQRVCHQSRNHRSPPSKNFRRNGKNRFQRTRGSGANAVALG